MGYQRRVHGGISYSSTCTRSAIATKSDSIMDKVDTWWDFDSGISIERDDDLGEDSSIGPLFLGLELAPSNVRYVPTTFSQELLAEADYGAIIGMTLTVMSVILVLLIAVSLVVYSKIIRRRTTSIHLGNDVYRTTIDGQEQLVPLQKYQIDSFQSFAVEETHKLAHLIQTV